MIREEGFSTIHNLPDGDLASFRVFELAAAINRLRGLTIANSVAAAEAVD